MTDDVLTMTEGAVGRIRLNRPKAIHALNTAMCAAMHRALDQWAADDRVAAVLVDHAEGRGFCAGGDIRMLAESGAADGVEARAFFYEEYRLNHAMFTYAKPIVAWMDGITMGGGVGISAPARFRVATENTRLAMPETGIGLFPDVGGGWYLSRLPGRIGPYLALTGARIDGADCLALGLATHFLPAERLEEAKARIVADPADIAAILSALSVTPPPSALMAERDAIDRLFAPDSVEGVFAALAEAAAKGDAWAEKQAAVLRSKSPESMKVSLRLVLDGRGRTSFAEEMAVEYAVATRVCRRHDFIEGVRALIVDKDNAPQWDPPTPETVAKASVDAIFAPLPAGEAWSPR